MGRNTARYVAFGVFLVALAATVSMIAWAVTTDQIQYAIVALCPLAVAVGAAKVVDNLNGGPHD